MNGNKQTVLVTGASRGIGFEHARQFAASGWQVLAAVRSPGSATALAALAQEMPGAVEIVDLLVEDEESVAELARRLAGRTIDVLINNAGTFGPRGAPEGAAYQGVEHMDYDIWRRILEVNLLAPFRISTALVKSLRRAQRPLNVMMSSDLGSIANNRMGQSYAYRTSKAGLNMIAKGMSVDWKDIITVAMAPGWCRTELGGDVAPIDPADSVRDQQQAFGRLTLADSGRFIDRFGQDVAW